MYNLVFSQATVMDSNSPRPYIQNMVVNAAYSPSSSFLSFVPSKQAALDCNSTTNLKLHYTATENVNFDLNYVVSAVVFHYASHRLVSITIIPRSCLAVM